MESRCENCIIRELNSLRALEKEELKRISDVKMRKSIKKGETIFKEGERLKGVFCVRKGQTKLSQISNNGRDQIVRIATKGEVLGQRSVIAEEQTNLSAIALNDMEVCFIPKAHLKEVIDNSPKFTKDILVELAHDLRKADNVIVNMAQSTAKQRIAGALLYMENKFGIDGDGCIDLVLSRADIANLVGTATEACIRMLGVLKSKKMISMWGKKIKIEDHTALQQIINDFS